MQKLGFPDNFCVYRWGFIDNKTVLQPTLQFLLNQTGFNRADGAASWKIVNFYETFKGCGDVTWTANASFPSHILTFCEQNIFF